jgi:hypothetical protein
MRPYLKYIIGLVFFLAVSSIVLRYVVKRNAPPFIFEKLESLRSNKKYMDSIGAFPQWEYKYNTFDFERGDTVKYTIRISGNDREMIYKGLHVRDSLQSPPWRLVEDTLLIRDKN